MAIPRVVRSFVWCRRIRAEDGAQRHPLGDAVAGLRHEEVMSFAAVRHTLFTLHLWTGLILGVLLAALGLSGSLLVYEDVVSDFLSPPPHATTAGMPLPLSMIANMAREAATEQGVQGGAMQIILPQKTGEAVEVRFNGISPMGNRPAANGEGRGQRGATRGLQMFLD